MVGESTGVEASEDIEGEDVAEDRVKDGDKQEAVVGTAAGVWTEGGGCCPPANPKDCILEESSVLRTKSVRGVGGGFRCCCWS